MSFFNYLQENNLLSQIAGDSIYIYPNIPQKKLVNAVNTYGNNLIKDFAEVKILIDDTIFGSAKDGMFITENDRLYFKMFGSDSGFVDIYELSKIRIEQSKLVLDIYDEDESEEKLFHLSYNGKKEKLVLFSFLNQYISNLGVIEPSNEIINESYEINELKLDKETKMLLKELKSNVLEIVSVICLIYPVSKVICNEKIFFGFNGVSKNEKDVLKSIATVYRFSTSALNQFFQCLKIYYKLKGKLDDINFLEEEFYSLFQDKIDALGLYIDFLSGKKDTFKNMYNNHELIEGKLADEYVDGMVERVLYLLEKEEIKARVLPDFSRWSKISKYGLDNIINELEDNLWIFYPRQYMLYNEGLIIGIKPFSSQKEAVDWIISLWYGAYKIAHDIVKLNTLIEQWKDVELEINSDSLVDYFKQNYQFYLGFMIEFSDFLAGEDNVYLLEEDLLEQAEEKVRENVERNYDKLSAVMAADPKLWFNFEDDDEEDEEEIEPQLLGDTRNVNSVKKEEKSGNSTLMNFLGNNVNKVADILSKNGIPLTTAVLNNDQMILKIAGIIYNILPTPVRFVLSLETVEKFLLENRTWLVQKLTK